MTQPAWISMHLFYHDHLGTVINHWVRPLVETLTQQHMIQRYFFIRYWQGGPHIRLRVLPTNGETTTLIKQIVEEHAARLFATHPAQISLEPEAYQLATVALTEFEYGQDRRVPLYANNSLHAIAYEPEYQRYGGVAGLAVVEQHFMESSAIALDLIDRRPSGQHTGPALAMLLLALAVCVNQPHVLERIFAGNYRAWQGALGPAQARFEEQAKRQYVRQRHELHLLTHQLMALLGSPGGGRRDPMLVRWIESIRLLNDRLRHLAAQQALDVLPLSSLGPEYRHAHFAGPATIVLRCVHMHNNRLGLTLADEAYLSFLLQHTFHEIGVAENAAFQAVSLA